MTSRRTPTRTRRTRAAALAASGVLMVAMLSMLAGTSSAGAAAAKAAVKPKPATGKVVFACNLAPFDSDFDYTATVKITGKRATKTAKAVSLVSSMTKMPGIAPVPVDAAMTTKLKLKVGTTAVTLNGKSKVVLPPSTAVPMPATKGSVKTAKNKLAVSVTSFSFNFADLGVSGTCTPSSGRKLTTMTVGRPA